MSKNIGKIIRVDSLPPKMDRYKNVIYQVSVPNSPTYIDYAIDENGDVKTPTLDTTLSENDFGKLKTINGKTPDSNKNIDLSLEDILDKEELSLNKILETEEKSITDKKIRIKTGGSIYVNNGEDFDEKWSKFFYTSSSEDNVTVATGIFNQTVKTWNYPTFYGLGALYNLNTENVGSSKSYTTAIGTQSMYNFTGTLANSSYNTALGYRSMYNLKGGLSNVSIGGLSLKSLETGSFNVALGTTAGNLLKTGDRNILIGHAIGDTGFTSGSFNTIIGTFTESILGDTLDNNVIIGSGINRVCFRTSELGLTTIPQQTNSLIDSDTTGKSVLTKEYLNFKNIFDILASATEEEKAQLKVLLS